MTLLILDIGSSSARAILFDDQARPIPGALVRENYHYLTTPPGAAMFDPPALLMDTIEACIDVILQHPAAARIEAVGIATFVGSTMGMGVTPLYLYADTRSADDVEALKGRLLERGLTPEDMHQRTGCLLHTAYQPGRLLWLRRTEPALFGRAPLWCDIGTALLYRWFGGAAVSYSAAAWTGMLNRQTLDWDAVWLSILGMSKDQFAPLLDYDTPFTGLAPAYRTRWGALANVPFFLPVGDGAAANIGSGCIDRTRIALTVGTTAALRIVSDAQLPSVPRGLWSYRVNQRLHLIGGATTEGGNIYQWMVNTLRLDGNVDLETVLSARTPDTHGLTFLPLLAGERSPGWRAESTGAIAGLRLSTTPLDILQAAMEGVSLRVALVAQQLESDAAPGAPLVASGGAFKSRAWAQMFANALNRPLYILKEDEITARGTAILALAALGRGGLGDYPPSLEKVVEPVPAHAAVMRAALERQKRLYDLG